MDSKDSGVGLNDGLNEIEEGVVFFYRWLLIIVVVAVVFRAGILLYAESAPARFDYPDSHRYIRVARNIAIGNGPMESKEIRAGTDPAYPSVLAVGVWLGCDDDASIMRFGRIVNACFGVLAVMMLAFLARRLVGKRAALVAAAILAVDPILLFFNALVLTETPYIFLLLLGVSILLMMKVEHRLTHGFFAGAVLGLATLTRSSNLLLPIAMLPLVWYLAGGKVGRRFGGCTVFLLGVALMLSGTTMRNYKLFHHFVPVHTSGGASLMEAWGPWADGSPGMDRIEYPAFPEGADEYTRDQICREAAFDWAAENPGRVLSLAWAKLKRTWSVTINAPGYSSLLYVLIGWLTTAPEFLLALIGLWLLRKRPWLVLMLLLPAIYFTLVHMVFVGSVRYRVPAMPFLFIPAGVAVVSLWRRIARGVSG